MVLLAARRWGTRDKRKITCVAKSSGSPQSEVLRERSFWTLAQPRKDLSAADPQRSDKSFSRW